jgi:hypothetical protein
MWPMGLLSKSFRLRWAMERIKSEIHVHVFGIHLHASIFGMNTLKSKDIKGSRARHSYGFFFPLDIRPNLITMSQLTYPRNTKIFGG